MDFTDHDTHGRELTWDGGTPGLAGAGASPGGNPSFPAPLAPVLLPEGRPIAETSR